MASRGSKFIPFFVAACLAVVRSKETPTSLCQEPVSASVSVPPQQLGDDVYEGAWCSGSNHEDPWGIPVAFLQVELQMNSSRAFKNNVSDKSARGRNEYSSHGRISSVASLALRVGSVGTNHEKAATTGGGLGIVVIGIVVFAIVLAIWLTLPDEVEDAKPRHIPFMEQRIASQVGSARALPQGVATVGTGAFRAAEGLLRSPASTMADRIDTSAMPRAAETTGVPPICQQLILPKTEARFQIKLNELMALTPGAKLEIKGTSGRTLLNAKLVAEGTSRLLQISSVGCDDDPRTTVKATTGGDILVLWGKSESGERTLDEAYGTIEPIPNSTANVLKHKGVPVMNIEMGDPRDLEMKVFSILTRRELANAGRVDTKSRTTQDAREPTRNEDYWKIAVKAGADAVLIASCMLGIVLLKGGSPSERLSATPMIGRSPAHSLTPALTPGATMQPIMQPQARPSVGLVPTRPGSLPDTAPRSPPTAYYRP